GAAIVAADAAAAAVDALASAPHPGAAALTRTPEPTDLAPAVAELACHLDAIAPPEPAAALVMCLGRALALQAAAPLAAALSFLPLAAARTGTASGGCWQAWGPLLASMAAAGTEGGAASLGPRPASPDGDVTGDELVGVEELVAAMIVVCEAAMTSLVAASTPIDINEVPGGAASTKAAATAGSRPTSAVRARSASLAAAALLCWANEAGVGAGAGAGSGGAARRRLAEAGAALAAAAGAPHSVVEDVAQQWRLAEPGGPGARALAAGWRLAHGLDHASLLSEPSAAAAVRAPAAAGLPRPAAAPLPHQAPLAAQQQEQEWQQEQEEQREARGRGQEQAPAQESRETQEEVQPAPADIRPAAADAVDADEAGAALDDLVGEICDASDRLCRRLARDAAALLGRGPEDATAAASAGCGGGGVGEAAGGVQQGTRPEQPQGRGERGPFADASELRLHFKALAHTAPDASAARARLLPLRAALASIEGVAGGLGPPAGAEAAEGGVPGGCEVTLDEMLWQQGEEDADTVGATPPPPARLLAVALGLLPGCAAATAAARSRLARAAAAGCCAQGAAAAGGGASLHAPEVVDGAALAGTRAHAVRLCPPRAPESLGRRRSGAAGRPSGSTGETAAAAPAARADERAKGSSNLETRKSAAAATPNAAPLAPPLPGAALELVADAPTTPHASAPAAPASADAEGNNAAPTEAAIGRRPTQQLEAPPTRPAGVPQGSELWAALEGL
ncbi:hypothetical protein MNEG_16273, partial [Monoraphidium neglectum]